MCSRPIFLKCINVDFLNQIRVLKYPAVKQLVLTMLSGPCPKYFSSLILIYSNYHIFVLKLGVHIPDPFPINVV